MEDGRKETENPQAPEGEGEERGAFGPGYWWRVIRALLFIVLVMGGCMAVAGLGMTLAQALNG